MAIETPCLPGLFDTKVRRHRPVRATSRAAYVVGREKFNGRKGDVLRWLGHHWNRFNVYPTSAELAKFVQIEHRPEVEGKSWDYVLLYVRRGLNDLVRLGVVKSHYHGKRICAQTGSLCETWTVTQR